MTSFPFELDSPRFPAWECSDLLKKAAARGAWDDSDNEIIRPMAGDPIVVLTHSNRQTLYLGPQWLMNKKAADIVSFVQRWCEFDKCSEWYLGRGSIEGLIRSFYPEGGQGLATVSLTPMRRPIQFRAEDDRRTEVTSNGPARLRFLPQQQINRRWDPKIRLGVWDKHITPFSLPLAGLPFACSHGSRPVDNRWVQVFVHRLANTTGFRLRPDQEHFPYKETWVCLACPGTDVARLSQGQTPAAAPDSYQGDSARVRTSPILTLLKIDLAKAIPWCQMLAMEIDASKGGLILSIRHCSVPWSVQLLISSSVEHINVCEILRRLA
jgi:hypothetical protein